MITNAKLVQLTRALHNLGIEYEIIVHPPIATVEEGLAFLDITAAQGVSTLIFIADGKPVSVIRRDDQKLSFKKIKKHLGVKNLAMASRDQLRNVTGCDIGYVSLYNPGLHPIMDATIFEQAYVYGGTGSPEHDLKIAPKELVRLTDGHIADVVEGTS